MSKKREIQTHFEELTVTVKIRWPEGSHLYGNYHLHEGGKYKVLATFLTVYVDGSQAPTFLIEADEGHIRPVACDRCAVVKSTNEQIAWQDIVNGDPNSEFRVGHGFERICATLETSGLNFPVYYDGDGNTVEEALAALDRDIAYQDELTYKAGQ